MRSPCSERGSLIERGEGSLYCAVSSWWTGEGFGDDAASDAFGEVVAGVVRFASVVDHGGSDGDDGGAGGGWEVGPQVEVGGD